MLFSRVPEAKVGKNPLHLDLQPMDRTRDEEYDRILALGATLLADWLTGGAQTAVDGSGSPIPKETPRFYIAEWRNTHVLLVLYALCQRSTLRTPAAGDLLQVSGEEAFHVLQWMA